MEEYSKGVGYGQVTLVNVSMLQIWKVFINRLNYKYIEINSRLVDSTYGCLKIHGQNNL